MLNKNFSVSAVRIKKFCADTTFDTQKLVLLTDFKAPYTLKEGLKSTIQNEFINQKK